MGTITVVCKLANGIYLDLRDDVGGLKKRVRINGYNDANSIAGSGYGLTEIDEGHWKEWLAVNSSLDLIKNQVVFAREKKSEAKAEAKSTGPSGQERIDPAKPLRGVKSADAE